jgi:hypothetical protein
VKAIEITAPGPADVLKLVERPMPAFGPGELLIRVAASGVNRPDVLQRKGLYPVPPGASDLPGLEVAERLSMATERRSSPRASRSAIASARWLRAAATPSTASHLSASACRARRI